jgi:flagellar L-ring protein FlgH
MGLNMIHRLLPFAACSLLAACATQIEEKASEAYDPVYPVEMPSETGALPTGGIYTASSSGLFASDRRANKVGDILTVEFTEKFAATKSQSASGGRSSSYEIDLPNILTGGFDDGKLTNGTNQSFKGNGAAQQSNSLTGLMSVSVVRVMPGGAMEILGQKRLTLNNGKEYVRISGVVRPEDIGPDNIVRSDRIAHADIQYVGAGDTADTAKPGWLRRGLNVISPL